MTADDKSLPKLSRPAHQALAAAGIADLEDLAKLSEAELAALHGIGPASIGPLKAALAAAGLSLRTT